MELLHLMLLADKRLDDTNRGYVFLHARVEVVVTLENLGKILVCARDDKSHYDSKEYDRDKVNAREPCVYQEGHCHRGDEVDRRAETDPQEHHIGVLDIRHVGRHSGYKTRR